MHAWSIRLYPEGIDKISLYQGYWPIPEVDQQDEWMKIILTQKAL